MIQDEGDRKPGSVPPELPSGDDHSSGTGVADCLKRPNPEAAGEQPVSHLIPPRFRGRSKWERLPIWSCSEWGLPSPGVTIGTGALLPHRFTLTKHGARWSSVPCMGLAVCFLWHFPWGRPHWTLSSTLLCGARTFLPPPGSEERSSGLLRPKKGRYCSALSVHSCYAFESGGTERLGGNTLRSY